MGSNRAEFLSRVAKRANLPEEDAEGLVEDFFNALAKMNRRAWEVAREMVPISVEAPDASESEPFTIEQFFLELSSEEPVEDRSAAVHARAVAGAIHAGASESQLLELRSHIEDDTLLALFEESRGELTSIPDPTDGEIAQHTPPKADREESPPLR